MNRAEARLPLPFTVIHAAIAGCAAIGLSFLLSGPGMPKPWVVVPALSVLFTLVLLMGITRSAERARQEAETRAISDPASGVLPAHLGRRVLAMAFAAAERGQPLSVVMFQIDGLEGHRVRHGAGAAVRLLGVAGRVLNARTRGMHVSTRHNGDDVFMSILSGVPLQGACTYAIRVRRDYAKLVGEGEPRSLSAGVAAYDVSMRSADQILRRAELALTRARDEGGKVVMVDPTGPADAREEPVGTRDTSGTSASPGADDREGRWVG